MSSSKPGILQPKKQIELFSGSYFGACTIGGIIGEPLALGHSHRLTLLQLARLHILP